jgi:RNA polymerase sigma factor (sigma-70 family)
MTAQLNSHLARTLTEDRLRRAAQRRTAKSAAASRVVSSPSSQDGDAGGAMVRRVAQSNEALDLIVSSAAAGDNRAWALLQARFTTRIRAVARLHRLSPHDIDDVVQTTWLRLLEHIGAVRDASAVGAWLETTARRESLRLLRRTNRERPTDDTVLADRPDEPVAERRLVTAELRAALDESLRQLPGSQRRLLVKMFNEPAATYAQISQSLGMPIGSIGPTRARSLARLRSDSELVSAIGEDVNWRPSGAGVR